MCVNSKIILTRYLYWKEDVLASLFYDLLQKNRDRSLFWAFELYYSGFEKEVFAFLKCVYHQVYFLQNTRLCKYVDKWTQENNPQSLANIILNFCSPVRKFTLLYFSQNELPDLQYSEQTGSNLIILSTLNLETFENASHSSCRSYKYLSKVCKFEVYKNLLEIMNCVHKDIDIQELLSLQTVNWLYYASFSPLWEKRIISGGGIIDHDQEKVVEEEEEDLQSFYSVYGYEPDEQKLETQKKYSHLERVDQLSLSEFYSLFKKKTVKKKVNVHLKTPKNKK